MLWLGPLSRGLAGTVFLMGQLIGFWIRQESSTPPKAELYGHSKKAEPGQQAQAIGTGIPGPSEREGGSWVTQAAPV